MIPYVMNLKKKHEIKIIFFSSGIDWIYEAFKFESNINTKLISKTINIFGKNKYVNSFFKKIADRGVRY